MVDDFMLENKDDWEVRELAFDSGELIVFDLDDCTCTGVECGGCCRSCIDAVCSRCGGGLEPNSS